MMMIDIYIYISYIHIWFIYILYIYYDCFNLIMLIYAVIPLHIGDDPHIFAFIIIIINYYFEAQSPRWT